MSSEPETCQEVELSVEGEEIVCETVVLQSEEDDEEDDEHSETLSVEGHRPVRPVERQKMRPWLIDLLDKNILPGLNWQNKKENIFRISWKHAAHNCFNRNRDSDLFERWAVHTGRHHEGNHKRWKANFRCALNSLPDVMELKELGVRKGDNAFKVYKFLDSSEPTMKEKMEIKRKYSLMAGIKLEESQSGSSTPTISTAPSSPDPESSVGVDGGIQTLLKAIELKTQQQDRTKTPQKRASTGGTTQTRSKKKKESKDGDSSEGVMYQLPMTITSGRPSPASTPGSEKSGQEDNEQLKMPYVGTIDPSTGKFTLVQLRKLHSTPVTSAIQRQETPVSIPVQSPSPEVTVANALRLQPQEQSVTIPLHLIQQELMQKQAPTAVNIATLIAANPTLQSMLMSSGTIPLTVMEKNNQAKLEAQRLVDQKTVTMVTENVGVLIPQVNKNITSIAAALRMANPPTPTSTAVTTMPSSGGLASDPQGIRSKLVSRLMVSGSSMTSPATNVRMPAGIQITAPMATPRPRLDHLLVKPNPSLTLPRTQLQPVKPIDHVVMATATSSNTDVSTAGGPPKLITGSEKTIDLNLNRGIVSMATVSRSKENSALLMLSGLSSPVCTPESRPDILDRQVTIELGKMDKEAQATRPTEDTQHYLCLWCQINFAKKSDLLHHFLQLHQDMLVVPGEADGQGLPESSCQATTSIVAPPEEMVADVSSTTQTTVADSTSDDIVIQPLDDNDDEPPVIIDVMINTSVNQNQDSILFQNQALERVLAQSSSQENAFVPRASSSTTKSETFHDHWGHAKVGQTRGPDDEELSNSSTISAAESEDSTSKPKYSLNDLIKALSQSLEQDQAKPPPLSVMLSPALQQFNLSQATALQADPGLSGIPSTVISGLKTQRGRGRGRGRGTGRGRGRRKKETDVSPEMPRLEPVKIGEPQICYDNLPESSDSGSNEGPPKISKIIKRRTPKQKNSEPKPEQVNPPLLSSPMIENPTQLIGSPMISYTSPLYTTTTSQMDAPFIPGLAQPSQPSISVKTVVEEPVVKSQNESSDQAIHVTVKMYEANGKTMYKCTECGKEFTKTCTFARHAMQHSKMYPYQCGICDMKCGDMRILLRHLDQHAEDADCPCQKCERMNKEFSEETQKKVSAAFHFKCNICGKKFFSDYACKMHVNAHKRKMTLTCEQCKLEFRCNRILSRHRKAVHDTQFCPVCLETCSNLVIHMKTHNGFTLYRCGLCGDGFNSRPNLHDHLKIHTQLGAKQGPSMAAVDETLKTQKTNANITDVLKDAIEAKMATETLMALGNPQGQHNTTTIDDLNVNTSVSTGDQSPTDFIVRTGEYEDEDGEIDVHVIPKTRSERFKSKSSDLIEDKDISVEVAASPVQKRSVQRKCRWHGNDSLCERCDDSFVKKMSANRKRKSAERGVSTRGRRGSKSPRSDYSDNSLKLNSDSLDSLKNLECSLPLANYILKGDDSRPGVFLTGDKFQQTPGVSPKPAMKDDLSSVIELSD